MTQQQNLSMSYRRKSVLSLFSMFVILFFCSHSSAFSQASAPQGNSNPDYVISHVRALDRLNKEKQLANRAHDNKNQLYATRLTIFPLEQLDNLVDEYKAEGFELITSSTSLTPDVKVANVKYYAGEDHSEGQETDNYNFFTGKMYHTGVP